MLSYDPVADLRHHPTPMARFGQNQYGANLYRVVWAPSRRYLACGTGPSGLEEALWLPLYRAVGEQWIMEGWRSAEDFAGVSRETWDASLSVLGPWPERGEYDWAWTFDSATVQDTNIEKVIQWIMLGRGSSFAEKIADAREREAKEQASIRATAQDMIRNKLPAFGCRPMFGSHGARGTNLPTLKYSAQDLGLPVHNGQTKTKVGPSIDIEIET